MALVTPAWFKQRQGKVEQAAENLVKITGPNLREAFLGIRQENGRWQSFVRHQVDGPDLASSTRGTDVPYDAWEVAFELYRNLDVI